MQPIFLLLALVTFAHAAEPSAACSVHLWWAAPPCQWFYNEATVRNSTPGSYFMVCGWNTGYFGIQELGDGRKIAIFSVWDPAKGDHADKVPPEQRVEVLHTGESVVVSRFGGEGTGGKSMMPFNWEIGAKVRCLVQASIDGDKSAYAGWLWMPATGSWKHLVTFRVKTGGRPLSGLYSFVEDFRRDGRSVADERRCEFGNGWVGTVHGKAEPIAYGTFTASTSANEARDAINAGRVEGGLFLANGGKVTKTTALNTRLEVKPVMPSPPAELPVAISNRQGLLPLPEGDHGIAAKHPGDRGIEKHPDVIFHDDFETGKVGDKWSNYYQRHLTTYTTDPANVHAGQRALEFTVPKQQTELSNGVDKELKGYDVVFMRYYSKFDKGFDQVGSSHNGGLLIAQTPDLNYSNPGLVANGRNKFQASFENWRGQTSDKSPGLMNVYVYHPAQRSQWGDHFFPNGEVSPNTSLPGDFGPDFTPRPQFIPELDRWYCFELMLRANTPGQRDGRIGCWVDGKLLADFPNLRFRDIDTLKIMRASLDLHIRENPGRENRKWYDDVVIATSYVGPMVGAK